MRLRFKSEVGGGGTVELDEGSGSRDCCALSGAVEVSAVWFWVAAGFGDGVCGSEVGHCRFGDAGGVFENPLISTWLSV